MTKQTERPRWRKACGTSTCVEVALTEEAVLVRDSKDLRITPLEFTHAQWAEFLGRATTGSFDFA